MPCGISDREVGAWISVVRTRTLAIDSRSRDSVPSVRGIFKLQVKGKDNPEAHRKGTGGSLL